MAQPVVVVESEAPCAVQVVGEGVLEAVPVLGVDPVEPERGIDLGDGSIDSGRRRVAPSASCDVEVSGAQVPVEQHVAGGGGGQLEIAPGARVRRSSEWTRWVTSVSRTTVASSPAHVHDSVCISTATGPDSGAQLDVSSSSVAGEWEAERLPEDVRSFDGEETHGSRVRESHVATRVDDDDRCAEGHQHVQVLVLGVGDAGA